MPRGRVVTHPRGYDEIVLRLPLEPVPASAPVARRTVAAWLQGRGLPSLIDDALLLTGELVANAVRHGEAPVELEISDLGGRIRVAVSDNGPGTPELRSPRPDDTSGRGIGLVAAVAARWGVEPHRAIDGTPGKTVWAELIVRLRVPQD